MDHSERAGALFCRGYNCAQASFAAFADLTGLSEAEALRLASGFGGGMGRMREVCGALSGIFLAAGYLYGYDEPDDEKKAALYRRIQALAEGFRAQFGAITCRELLDHPDSTPDPTPRTAEFYANRPCRRFIEAAAALLDKMTAQDNRREAP